MLKEKIEKLRKAKGWSKREAAQRCRLSYDTFISITLVGHSDFRTTIKTYGHMDPEYRDQIKKLDF